jgi:hypothetical protein
LPDSATRPMVVNTSAGDEGLWFYRMNFDDESWSKGKSEIKRVAEVSRGNSFAERDLLNYTDDPFPGFMRSDGKKEEGRVDSDSDRWRITGYRDPADIGRVMKSALGLNREGALFDLEPDRGPGQAQVLGNSDKKLLVADRQSLRVVNLTVSRKERDIQAKASKSFPPLS